MASKRTLVSPPGPSSGTQELEEEVDTKVTDTVQQVLSRLQTERERLIQLAAVRVEQMTDDEKNACNLTYQADPSFDAALETLLSVPLGDVHISGLKTPRLAEKHGEVVSSTPSPNLEESNDTSLESKSPASIVDPSKPLTSYEYDAAIYKRMCVVRVVTGKDLLGTKIEKPHGILRLPGSDCLAFIHNENHISLLASNGKIVASFKLKVKYRPSTEFLLRPWEQSGLGADGKKNELYVLDTFSRIQKVKPSEASSRADNLVPILCKSLPANVRAASGLAISTKVRMFYSALGDELIGYSLKDWSTRASFGIKRGAPTVVACTDSHLYYKFADEHDLYRIALHEDGSFSGQSAKFCGDLKKIRGVSFDPAGNVLIVDNGRRRIEVLSAQGNYLCSINPESPAKESFYPSGVAFLEPSQGSNFRPIMAITDYYADCVLFFAPGDV